MKANLDNLRNTEEQLIKARDITESKMLTDVFVLTDNAGNVPAKILFLTAKNADGAGKMYCVIRLELNGQYLAAVGSASGYGYCKRSAAFANALKGLNIELDEPVAGVDMRHVREAVIAIVEASSVAVSDWHRVY
jgi:hypothetical protein